MSSDEIVGDGNHQLYTPPVPNWEWSFNGDWYAMTVSLALVKPPNWFHRFMQRVCLGIHWRKIL